MDNFVTFERHSDVGIIVIDNPPVNALSHAVTRGLNAALDEFAKAKKLRALVLHGAGSIFVAGASIPELSDPGYSVTPLKNAMNRIEALDRPAVCALHGAALGGGLELALACHYRVAVPGSRFGLPEVMLGVLPGCGGTQRLPRLVSPQLALDLIMTGRSVDAATALRIGLIDELQDQNPLDLAIEYARRYVDADHAGRRLTARRIDPAGLPTDFFKTAMADAIGRKGKYPAARRIVRCVEAATTMPAEEALALEEQLFQECRRTSESRALRHLFFAEREASKIPGVPSELPIRAIKKVGVVGAGTMGGGIAMNFASDGVPVVVVEGNPEALTRGLGIVRGNYEATAKKGRLTDAQVEERMAQLHGTVDYSALADCDLVIEAVFENLDLKKEVLAKIGKICKPGAIIASNTSTLDVDVLADASGRPSDVVGTHFFSPANVMRLLELVRGAQTAPDVLLTLIKLARQIGKVPVVSGVCYGFIGNRMLERYVREQEFLLMEGATPAKIDAAIENLGFSMGPCRMMDLAGLDVGAKVVLEQAKLGALPLDPSYRAPIRRMFELGHFGQKTGIGYYLYEGRKRAFNPEFHRICEELAAKYGIKRRSDICEQEVVERCIYPLVNEGARILEEGIAIRPGDIDVVWTNGYAFPDYRGGPMFMADEIGIQKIVERLNHYAGTRGYQFGYWAPCKLMSTLAAEKRRISDFRADTASSKLTKARNA
jgi:3-hydroxyacyl-CoA dehydrogenase